MKAEQVYETEIDFSNSNHQKRMGSNENEELLHYLIINN